VSGSSGCGGHGFEAHSATTAIGGRSIGGNDEIERELALQNVPRPNSFAQANTVHPHTYTQDAQHPQGLVQSAVMVVAAASKWTQQGASAVPASASATPAAGPSQRRGKTSTTKAAPQPPPSRAAAFVPPLLSQEPHAGEPYRAHVKVIPPSKERVARVIKQAHHKVRTVRVGQGSFWLG